MKENYDFSVFNHFENPVIKIKLTKIIQSNLIAEKWGIKPNKEITDIISFDFIDDLILSIMYNKYFSKESNIYFLNSKTRYCLIKYIPEDNLIYIQDKTQFELLKTVKSDFISSISHELRTPLSIAKGNIHILEDFLLDNQYSLQIKKISKSLNRIEKIINQITLLSMAEFGSYSIKKEIIDTNILLNEVKEDLNKKLLKKNINIIINNEVNILEGDRFIFYTILRNLISNSIKYSYEKTNIYVDIRKKFITVKDYGIGIKDDELIRIFERFYRTQEAIKKAKGSGLGLSIVKYFCELANYKITVNSNWGTGSEFKIILSE